MEKTPLLAKLVAKATIKNANVKNEKIKSAVRAAVKIEYEKESETTEETAAKRIAAAITEMTGETFSTTFVLNAIKSTKIVEFLPTGNMRAAEGITFDQFLDALFKEEEMPGTIYVSTYNEMHTVDYDGKAVTFTNLPEQMYSFFVESAASKTRHGEKRLISVTIGRNGEQPERNRKRR